MREAGALFGACHYPEFHFLVTCSDDLGYLGLEHLTSSLNGVRERDLIDDARRKGWVANLLPHEYVHSWCGKFRRPAGMCTPDFHTPQKTRLLWVYEGLAEYLGEVLMVRSGLVDPKEYRETLAATISTLSHHEGRRWRSLEDTAVASHLLRGEQPQLERPEARPGLLLRGSLIWLEADAIIRDRSQGKKSLDDFCRKFLGANRPPPRSSRTSCRRSSGPARAGRLRLGVVPDRAGLAAAGGAAARCGRPVRLPPPVRDRAARRYRRSRANGRHLGPRFARPDLQRRREDHRRRARHGRRPGRPGPGMKVIGVNNKTFSRQRLLDALADSVAAAQDRIAPARGRGFRTIVLDYADGPRYLELVRDESKPDMLAEILKPAGESSQRRSQRSALPGSGTR